MRATVKYVSSIDGAEIIHVNGHRLQFGHDRGGDGFCYGHQSFDCLDHLTDEEKIALRTPDYDIEEPT